MGPEGSWWGSRRLRRRDGDLRALESALQCRDTRGDIAFLAGLQPHSDVQGPGITVRVVAREQAIQLLAAGQRVLARCLCEKSALGRRRIDRRGRFGIDGKRARRDRFGITNCKDCVREYRRYVEEVRPRDGHLWRWQRVRRHFACTLFWMLIIQWGASLRWTREKI